MIGFQKMRSTEKCQRNEISIILARIGLASPTTNLLSLDKIYSNQNISRVINIINIHFYNLSQYFRY